MTKSTNKIHRSLWFREKSKETIDRLASATDRQFSEMAREIIDWALEQDYWKEKLK